MPNLLCKIGHYTTIMNRFLQKLLFFSAFLLLLSGWQRFISPSPGEPSATSGSLPAFEQPQISSSPTILAPPFLLAPYGISQQFQIYAAGPVASLYSFRSTLFSRNLTSCSPCPKAVGGGPFLYLLYRKLRL